jgi:hypothetical protein
MGSCRGIASNGGYRVIVRGICSDTVQRRRRVGVECLILGGVRLLRSKRYSIALDQGQIKESAVGRVGGESGTVDIGRGDARTIPCRVEIRLKHNSVEAR